jgi:glycosyltransferase involved in cell wall biosynthesis
MRLPVSVIVPVRNAEHLIAQCLTAIFRAGPQEVIVVDGNSVDGTREVAQQYPIQLLSDNGAGVPAARMMGIEMAVSEIVVLVDVDIVFPEGALEDLYTEFVLGQYDALQAGLISSPLGPGYWGRALTVHHNRGRSKNWPGVMATIFRREVLRTHRFDESFRSGEDIELRWRLQKANLKVGVSQKTFVKHLFGDTFAFAKDQFVADGQGLGRMVAKYGWPAAKLLLLPAAGCARGISISLLHLEPGWIPYYLVYLYYNYVSMPGSLRERLAS